MARPTFNDLTAFQDVAAHRSFRKAADARGTSPSTLSHTLRALEENLGVRLLNRTTRSVSLTEAGAMFLDRIGPTLNDLDLAINDLGVFRGEPSGKVRINAPEVGARLLVQHVLPVLQVQYPQVEVDLVVEGRLIDIVDDGFDAGVRLGEMVPQDMIAVPFGGPVTFIAVAAPAYLDRTSRPSVPDDLKQHECIRQRMPSGKAYRWEFVRNGQDITIDVPGKLTLDHSGLMAEAAADGLGIAYIPDIVARDLVEAGRLQKVLTEWCPRGPGLALYYPGKRQLPTGLRALINILKAELFQGSFPVRQGISS